MISIKKDPKLDTQTIQLGITEVYYPARTAWHTEDFYTMVDVELALLRTKYAEYDREELFKEHPCFRFFEALQTVYPVTLNLEAVLLKNKAFPRRAPMAGISLLTSLYTLLLTGICNADAVQGELELFLTDAGEIGIRDNDGTLFRMISGAEERARVKKTTRHVLYPVLGAPGLPREELRAAQVLLEGCARVLAPESNVESIIL